MSINLGAIIMLFIESVYLVPIANGKILIGLFCQNRLHIDASQLTVMHIAYRQLHHIKIKQCFFVNNNIDNDFYIFFYCFLPKKPKNFANGARVKCLLSTRSSVCTNTRLISSELIVCRSRYRYVKQQREWHQCISIPQLRPVLQRKHTKCTILI